VVLLIQNPQHTVAVFDNPALQPFSEMETSRPMPPAANADQRNFLWYTKI